ncbi:hypothetical protein [Shewanella youngdeokensis]|uniref:Lipoprotein n=1 Tax=Shewanella youngdeokensis TaxID=2999068 RepID=A0ABZ0K0U9_9GAMM|nr:hypothetical protein RGE70_05005 [Shewanella sp. DAU334]
MKTQTDRFINVPCSLIALSFFALTACGGGGGDEGGSSATPAAATPVTPTPVTPTPVTPTPVTPEPVVNPTSLDDLVVDADNALESSFTLNIAINTASQSRGYFSLCDDYTANGGGYEVNFDSCLFRGPLSDGQLSKELKVANHHNKLIAVIWFYDGQDPQYQQWAYNSDNAQQTLTMN